MWLCAGTMLCTSDVNDVELFDTEPRLSFAQKKRAHRRAETQTKRARAETLGN